MAGDGSLSGFLPGYELSSDFSHGDGQQNSPSSQPDLPSSPPTARNHGVAWIDMGSVDFSGQPSTRPVQIQAATSATNHFASSDITVKVSPSARLASAASTGSHDYAGRLNQTVRPISFPPVASTALNNPYGANLPIARPRPYSIIGTQHDPYRASFDVPRVPQYDPLMTHGITAMANTNTPAPQTTKSGYGPAVSVLMGSLVPPFEDDGSDKPEGSFTDEPEQKVSDEEESGAASTPVATVEPTVKSKALSHRKTGQRSKAVTNFAKYPSYEQDPPTDLSCYDVCQQYPASLHHDNLRPFIQRRWSAGEIFHCLPVPVQQSLLARDPIQTTMYLDKRLQKIRDRLKLNSSAQYLVLMNAAKLRADGRPAHVYRFQSVKSPTAKWRKDHGMGIDPQTRRYVALPPNSEANAPELLEAVPFDFTNQPDTVPPQHSHATPSSGDAPSSKPQLQRFTKTNKRNRNARDVTQVAREVSQDQSDCKPTSGGPVPPTTRPTAHNTRTPIQPSTRPAGNMSNDRSPTLLSMFPPGSIDIPGAYVRTVSPGGSRFWHGAPSPEFIESYILTGGRRFLLDITLPHDYVPPSRRTGDSRMVFTNLPDELDEEWVADTIEVTESVPPGMTPISQVVTAEANATVAATTRDAEAGAYVAAEMKAAKQGQKRRAEEMDEEDDGEDEEVSETVKRIRMVVDEDDEIQRMILQSIDENGHSDINAGERPEDDGASGETSI